LPSDAEGFYGEVVSVPEGDTIEVLCEGRPVRVRLRGIDCPGHDQSYGDNARQFTSSLVLGKGVTVDVFDKHQYGELVGDVYCADGKLLSHELARAGLAWYYLRHSRDKTIERIEREARATKRGLWSDAEPTPPWLFAGKPAEGTRAVEKRGGEQEEKESSGRRVALPAKKPQTPQPPAQERKLELESHGAPDHVGRPPSRSGPQQIVGGAIPHSQPEEPVERPQSSARQEYNRDEAVGEACAYSCLACEGCIALSPIVAVMWFVIGFVFLVWVARDAKARNIDSAALWMVFVLVTGVIGLVIYILARPEGKLVQCPHCHNKRLEVSATCPHCGNT